MTDHKVGDLLYYKSRIDDRNGNSLGVIVKKDQDDNDLYYVKWLDNDNATIYSSIAIKNFKRNLKLLLEGFE